MEIPVKANPAKKTVIDTLESKIQNAQSIVFADFKGLSVAQMNQLRSNFFKAGDIEFYVSKNTLIRIALKQAGHEDYKDVLRGNTGLALSYDDPIKTIKVIADFAKDTNGKPVFKGGIVDGAFCTPEEIEELKKIPPKDQLIALVIGNMTSPLSGFVGVLNEIVRSFVGVIDAIIEQKKASGEE